MSVSFVGDLEVESVVISAMVDGGEMQCCSARRTKDVKDVKDMKRVKE
jgi:hypothetical protein